jgi:hypothetical protein
MPNPPQNPDKTLQTDWSKPQEPDKTLQTDWTKPQSPDKTLKADWSAQARPKASTGGPVLVDESDLIAWLDALFQTYPECSRVTVEKVVRLEVPDSEGCNWSRALVLNPGGVSPEDYAPAYAAIVEKARKAFNLRELIKL